MKAGNFVALALPLPLALPLALVLVLALFAFARATAADEPDMTGGSSSSPRSSNRAACRVLQAEGDVRYRVAGSLNWLPLGQRQFVFAGDVLFTRAGASVVLEYSAAGTSVQLPQQSLFRVTESAPVFTKIQRRLGLEKTHEKGNGLENRRPEKTLGILRKRGKLPLEFPRSRSIILASTFPAPLHIRVSPDFSTGKFWAYVWKENNTESPVWSGFSGGEFAAVPIQETGKYIVQVMNDAETLFSDPVAVEVLQDRRGKNIASEKAQSSLGTRRSKTSLGALLMKLSDITRANNSNASRVNIFVE